jgi:hypothetical protein
LLTCIQPWEEFLCKHASLILGQEILQIEKTPNELFANKSISDSEFQKLIKKSAENYGKHRYIHLTTHLKMIGILSRTNYPIQYAAWL